MRVLLHFLRVFRPQFPEESIPSSFATVQEVLGASILPLLERRDELKFLHLIDNFVESFQEKWLQQLPAGRGCRLLVLEQERPTKCLLPERLHDDDCCVLVAQLVDCVETTYLEAPCLDVQSVSVVAAELLQLRLRNVDTGAVVLCVRHLESCFFFLLSSYIGSISLDLL
jgi:hypothetical protein